MRPVALVAALALAVASLPLSGERASAATLNAQIDLLAGSFPGGASIWVADPSLPQPLYARDADHEVIAASLYKLAVLLEAEHQVELGHLRYTDTITIEPEDITGDGSFEAAGTELTVDEALEQMITVSDNGTALHLWRMLGPASINAFLAKSGVARFHIALDETEDHVVTARAVGTLLTLLAQRKLVSPAASDRMRKRLERQEVNDRIPAQLPEGTVVAHKTGNLVGVVHDAGIIVTPRGPRVLVALTWDTDDDVADAFIAHVASTVYAAVLVAPAAPLYRVPSDPQYVETGTSIGVPVTIKNAGDLAWTEDGIRRMGLVWELRDSGNTTVARSGRPIPLGLVAPGASVSLPVVVTVPQRGGDMKLVLGLADAAGKPLAPLGVATATVPLRVHLPFVANAVITVPSALHRREASMVEVDWDAIAPVRADDHFLSLGWRLIDEATDRIVAQGTVPLGLMRTYQRTGSFFAPLVAPSVRGTYTIEYELRERGFIASVTQQRTVRIGPARTYGDDVPRRPRP